MSSGWIVWFAPLTTIVAPGRSNPRTVAFAAASDPGLIEVRSGNFVTTTSSVSPATSVYTDVRAYSVEREVSTLSPSTTALLTGSSKLFETCGCEPNSTTSLSVA